MKASNIFSALVVLTVLSSCAFEQRKRTIDERTTTTQPDGGTRVEERGIQEEELNGHVDSDKIPGPFKF